MLSREPFSNYRKLIIIGIVIHIITAIFSVGYYHVDEHFQILEFTSLKLGIAQEDELPWEYQDRLRPALQPTFAFVLIKIMNLIMLDNPFFHATILRLISAILSLYCMYLLIRSLSPEIRPEFLIKWYIFLSLMIWFLPYLHVRFSSENWAGLFFWIGFALLNLKNKEGQISDSSNLNVLFAGLIFGLSFILRFQVGLLIGGYILWLIFIKKEKWATLALLSTGIMLFIFIGTLIDCWFYNEWTITAWNYFKVNILEGKTTEFGIEPWWYYIEEIMIKGSPPYGVVIIISTIFIWYKYPKHMLTWISIPYIAVHLLIGHKELRFLFPLVNIIPFMIILSIQSVKEDQSFLKLKNLLNAFKKPLLILFMIINSILLFVVSIKPADMQIYLYQYLYNTYDPEKTEIISLGRGPYHRAVPVNFYKKKALKLKRFDNVQAINEYILTKDKTMLYATKSSELDSSLNLINCSQVYQLLPPGVKYYNINNWVERTHFWTLYECQGGSN